MTQHFCLRRVNPFLGTVAVVKTADGRAITVDGRQWQLQVLAHPPRGLWSRGGEQTAMRYFRFGIWSEARGLGRVPLNPISMASGLGVARTVPAPVWLIVSSKPLRVVNCRPRSFPSYPLRTDWSNEGDRQLVGDYIAWLAPYLLTLPGLDRALRSDLEGQAVEHSLLTDALCPLYPEVVHRDLLNQARVEARLRRANS